MSKVILGVGLPGSGKTTVLKPFAEKHAYTYISPDDIRAELLGDAADQSKNEEVWREAYARTAHALSTGASVVFDATFAERETRREFIEFVKAQGADDVQGVYASVSPEVVAERNLSRERVVPETIIDEMREALAKEPPVIEDGFDSLVSIDEFQELPRAEKEKDDSRWVNEFKPKLR